jgi:hypothetical protein
MAELIGLILSLISLSHHTYTTLHGWHLSQVPNIKGQTLLSAR